MRNEEYWEDIENLPAFDQDAPNKGQWEALEKIQKEAKLRQIDIMALAQLLKLVYEAGIEEGKSHETKIYGSRMLILLSKNAKLKRALQVLVSAPANMRVPQTLNDVALQVFVTLGPALTRTQTILADINDGE